MLFAFFAPHFGRTACRQPRHDVCRLLSPTSLSSAIDFCFAITLPLPLLPSFATNTQPPLLFRHALPAPYAGVYMFARRAHLQAREAMLSIRDFTRARRALSGAQVPASHGVCHSRRWRLLLKTQRRHHIRAISARTQDMRFIIIIHMTPRALIERSVLFDIFAARERR